jgi:hypothetical protein
MIDAALFVTVVGTVLIALTLDLIVLAALIWRDQP